VRSGRPIRFENRLLVRLRQNLVLQHCSTVCNATQFFFWRSKGDAALVHIPTAGLAQAALRGLDAADVAGQLHGLVGLRGLGVALRHGFELPDQSHACGVVACGLGLLCTVGADEQTLAGSQGSVGVGAQLEAQAAEAASVARFAIAGLMNQVPEVQLAGVLGGGELNAKLLVGVVEDEWVVS
jgi:hypothetical protein